MRAIYAFLILITFFLSTATTNGIDSVYPLHVGNQQSSPSIEIIPNKFIRGLAFLVITGQNTHFDDTTSISFNPSGYIFVVGILFSSPVMISPTLIIYQDAPFGTYILTVSTGTESVSGTIEIVESISTTTTTANVPCSVEDIYGEHSEKTELLRYFRDNVLTQTPEGQEIIKLYYQWSPAIVKAVEEDEEFKEEVKEVIDKILPLIGKEIE